MAPTEMYSSRNKCVLCGFSFVINKSNNKENCVNEMLCKKLKLKQERCLIRSSNQVETWSGRELFSQVLACGEASVDVTRYRTLPEL